MSSTDENDIYTVSQLREALDGHGQRDLEAHPHAGVVENASRDISASSARITTRKRTTRRASSPGAPRTYSCTSASLG